MRFRTHYFPFTEPSLEPDVCCFLCDGRGCPVCRYSGWIEIAGSGMVDPPSSSSSGSTPRSGSGFAFGMGLERVAMLRHGLPALGRCGRTTSGCSGSSEMKVPVTWLREYVEVDAATAEIADRLAIATGEVERISCRGVADEDGNHGHYLVGRVLEAGKHPNADRFQLCRVDVGEEEPRQIVCGAWNFGAGATVAVALPGAVLPDGRTLERAKLRGSVSDGMILSEAELELGDEQAGSSSSRSRGSRERRSRDVLPLGEEVLEVELTPNRPDLPVGLRHRPRGRRALRRRAEAAARRGAARARPTSART